MLGMLQITLRQSGSSVLITFLSSFSLLVRGNKSNYNSIGMQLWEIMIFLSVTLLINVLVPSLCP